MMSLIPEPQSNFKPTSSGASQLDFAHLRDKGWVLRPQFLPFELCQEFYKEIRALEKERRIREARIGQKQEKTLKKNIRNTKIFWINNLAPTPTQKLFLNPLFELMEKIRKQTFLALNNIECHYALYPKGGFYVRHLDQFQGDRSRQISFILYLNPEWSKTDGGELVIYNEKDPSQIDQKVLPQAGLLALFLSESIEHEVLVTQRPRYSLTGWMKISDIQDNPLSLVK